MLHRSGYRFTVTGPRNRKLPGRPDLVLPKYGTVIFVHGCFWHGHPHCPDFRLPATRREWWRAKIDGNRARDLRVQHELRNLGWHVVTISPRAPDCFHPTASPPIRQQEDPRRLQLRTVAQDFPHRLVARRTLREF